ncbi:MAG: fibronectin type III domain-containing protein [candidate division Zixibacteria bacterium]|nr:fibronectin type III domain-containing protein [candidate division Zixibacteria bacterium]
MRILLLIYTMISLVLLIVIGGCYGSKPTAENIPESPSELSGLATGAYSVSLQWQDNSENETGFIIYRRITGPFGEIGRTNANTTNYNDTIQQSCIEAHYYVSASNSSGESAISNQISVQMICGEGP